MNINRYGFLSVYFCTMLFTFVLFLLVAFLNQYFITGLVYDVKSIDCNLLLDTAEALLVNRYLTADGLLTMPHKFISNYWGWVVPVANIFVLLMIWVKQLKAPKFSSLVPIIAISLIFFGLSMFLGNSSNRILDYHNSNNHLAKEVMLLRHGIDLDDDVSLVNNRDYRFCYNSGNISVQPN